MNVTDIYGIGLLSLGFGGLGAIWAFILIDRAISKRHAVGGQRHRGKSVSHHHA